MGTNGGLIILEHRLCLKGRVVYGLSQYFVIVWGRQDCSIMTFGLICCNQMIGGYSIFEFGKQSNVRLSARLKKRLCWV